MIPVVVFTLLYNVSKFFELTVRYIPTDYVIQQVRDSKK